MLAGLTGCSSQQASKDSKAATTAPDKIQGKVQIALAETSATDSALNAGGASVYLWEGMRRYRLFFRTPISVEGGEEYIAEGVYAQKLIDDLGDPDQGKNGYPLATSCDRVVKTAWPGLAFDVTDLHAATLRHRVQRYPARPVFLVTRLRTAETKAEDAAARKDTKAAEKNVRLVTIAAEKQRAQLIEGPTSQMAPLWAPAGGTVKCGVIIDAEGKISELQTGNQLCEYVPWSQFRYKPAVQGGRAVQVDTEVEVRFEPRDAKS
jgi:hypothetical protein